MIQIDPDDLPDQAGSWWSDAMNRVVAYRKPDDTKLDGPTQHRKRANWRQYYERVKKDPEFVEKNRERCKKYRESDPEAARARSRAWHHKHKDDPGFKEKQRLKNKQQYLKRKAKLNGAVV